MHDSPELSEVFSWLSKACFSGIVDTFETVLSVILSNVSKMTKSSSTSFAAVFSGLLAMFEIERGRLSVPLFHKSKLGRKRIF